MGTFLACPPVQFPEKGKSSPQVFRGIATQGSGPHRSTGQAVICRINKGRKQGREARLSCHVSTSDVVPVGPAVPGHRRAWPALVICVQQLPCKLAAGPGAGQDFSPGALGSSCKYVIQPISTEAFGWLMGVPYFYCHLLGD